MSCSAVVACSLVCPRCMGPREDRTGRCFLAQHAAPPRILGYAWRQRPNACEAHLAVTDCEALRAGAQYMLRPFAPPLLFLQVRCLYALALYFVAQALVHCSYLPAGSLNQDGHPVCPARPWYVPLLSPSTLPAAPDFLRDGLGIPPLACGIAWQSLAA